MPREPSRRHTVVAAGRILPGPFRWIARSPEAILVWSLALCFAMIVAAKSLSLSLELGAFLAGVSLAQLPYNQDLRRRVAPLPRWLNRTEAPPRPMGPRNSASITTCSAPLPARRER